MTPKEIGAIIKEARLSKKMTQNEVVGNFITRNMLSQIENGTATPSIKTLQYLAQQLDLSLSQFDMDETHNDHNSNIYNTMVTHWKLAKTYYCNKDYENCLEQLTEFTEENDIFYDEGCALTALCYLKLAILHGENNDIKEAMQCADNANHYAQLGIFKNQQIITESVLLLNSLAEQYQKKQQLQ